MNDLIVVIFRFAFYYLESQGFNWTIFTSAVFPQYIVSASLVDSNYILLCWTVERMCAAAFPLKFNLWFTMRREKWSLAMAIGISCIVTTPYLYGYGIAKYIRFLKVLFVLPVIFCRKFGLLQKLCITLDCHFFLIVACNIVIIKSLARTTNGSLEMTQDQEIVEKKKLQKRKLTRTLITISPVFELLHIPYALALIWCTLYPDLNVILQHSTSDYIHFMVYTNLVIICSEFHNWNNFCVYIIPGEKFREAFVLMICRHISQAGRFTFLTTKTRFQH